jgi:hypothetical protein
MEPDHLLGVHPVDVIRTENDYVVGVFVVDQVERLIDRVGGAGVPARAEPLLRRHRGDVLAGQAGQPPVLRNVTVQRMRLVLSENADPQVPGVDEIGEHEVDQSIGAPKGNRGLGPVRGQRIKPLALTTGQDNAQHVWWRIPHGTNLSAATASCQQGPPQ